VAALEDALNADVMRGTIEKIVLTPRDGEP
jgi:hypothetical protein